MPPVCTMQGEGQILKVFEDRVELAVTSLAAQVALETRGIYAIPYITIASVQMQKSGFLNGYLQFTVDGDVPNVGGRLGATGDPNSFMFHGNNKQAAWIRDYVEMRARELRRRAQARNSTPDGTLAKRVPNPLSYEDRMDTAIVARGSEATSPSNNEPMRNASTPCGPPSALETIGSVANDSDPALIDHLLGLDMLRRSGALTEDEFAMIKRRLLG